MPALDNSAATNAQSLLNGIDYGAVIGAPLTAAVKAQVMAAQSTADFIQQVGFNAKTGEVNNVEFIYQRDGEMVKLIVPLLSIVPIPALEITQVQINFKASINASASQASENSKSTDVAAGLDGSAKVGFGPFSANVNFKASVSSKSASKATQDSRYSVEYTQEIGITAQQAGMPAGLATVLSILSNAATGTSVNGEVQVSPALASVSLSNPDSMQTIELLLRNGSGLNVTNAPVTITAQVFAPDATTQGFRALTAGGPGDDKDPLSALFLAMGPVGVNPVRLSELAKASFRTNSEGRLPLLLWADPKRASLLQGHKFQLDFEANVGTDAQPNAQHFSLPIAVTGTLPLPPASAGLKGDSVDLPAKGSEKASFVATATRADGSAAAGIDVTAAVSGGDLQDKLQVAPTNPTEQTDKDGKKSFTVSWKDSKSPGEAGKTGTVTLSATIDGSLVTTTVMVAAVAAPEALGPGAGRPMLSAAAGPAE